MTLRPYQREGVEASPRYLGNGGNRGVPIAPSGRRRPGESRP